MPSNGIRELLERAQRRSFLHLLLTQSIYALGTLCVGGSLLLLFGTQVLHPFWFWLLLGATLGVLSYRLRGRVLSPYRLAQRIDAACGFHDALSTALHFEKVENRREALEPLRVYQYEQAQTLAAKVNLVEVLPFHMTRAIYVTAALFAVAAGLFAYRYAVTRKLDLQAPLVSFHIDAFSAPKEVAKQQKDLRQQLQDQLKQMGVTLAANDGSEGVDPQDQQPFNPPAAAVSADNEAGSPGQEQSAKTDRQGNPGKSNEQVPGDKNDDSKDGTPAPTNEQGESQGKDGSNPDGPQGAAPQQGGKPSGQQPGKQGDNSMLSKLRDNLANMLNKLKQPSANGENQQGANQAKQNQQGSQGENQKGTPTPSRTAANQNAQGEQQADQQGEGGEKSQSASSKQGDKNSQQPSSDSKSGVGKQDGDKDVKAAEQLAAMGKLSELLGKRSQNVTGEITVETPGGKQQLITPYSQRRATHAEAGGESNRDEIPLAYQHYVQQYFEQIHKGKRAEPPVQKQ